MRHPAFRPFSPESRLARGRPRWPSRIVAAAAALVLAAISAPAHADTPYMIQSGLTYYSGQDFNYMDLGSSFDFNAFNYSSGQAHFGFGDRFLGADVTVGADAIAGVSGYASAVNQLNYSWRQPYVTAVVGADNLRSSVVGTPFTIGTNASFDFSSVSTNSGQFEMGLNSYANIGVGAYLHGCALGICDGTNIGIGNAPNGTNTTIAAYSSATNTATILDQTYTNALPQTYSAPDLAISATVSKLDLSGANTQSKSQGTLANGVAELNTSHPAISASVNVASVVAQAVGIPPEALEDSIAGFHYITLGAQIGASVDLNQILLMRPDFVDHVYHFSSPVDVFNTTEGYWTGPLDSITLKSDQFAQVRALNAANLGVTVENRASFEVDTSLSASAALQAQLVILHVDGHGFDDSVIDKSWDLLTSNLDLGNQTSFTATQSVFEAPINLAFNQVELCQTCTTTGLVQISFNPPPTQGSDTSKVNQIFRANNYGTIYCNDTVTSGCHLDTSSPPAFNRSRTITHDDGTTETEYSNGFTTVDSLAATPDSVVLTPTEEQAAQLALLQRTYPGGVRPNVDLNLSSVPEPATWAEMLLGVAMMGAVRRRRLAR